MFKRLLPCLSILLLFCAFVGNPQTAQACSGGTSPFQIERLPTTSVIVYGRAVEADDRGYNAVIEVERYYKGSGGRYLAVSRWTPGLQVGSGIRGYDVSCLYTGGGEQWQVGRYGYFALYKNADGTFTDTLSYGQAVAHFYVEGSTVVPVRSGYAAPTFGVKEFERLLLDAGDYAIPYSPGKYKYVNDYPLMRFAILTTENGTHYRLNADRSITRLRPTLDPLAISPDGSHIAFRVDEDTVGLQYVFTEPIRNPRQAESEYGLARAPLQRVEGNAVRFSSDSNLVAVWDEGQFSIYLFDNQKYFDYFAPLRLQKVASAHIHSIGANQPLQLVWNADSTTVVYADARGVWRWNIFQEAQPAWIVPMDVNAPLHVLDVSRSGQYIRYGVSQDWTLLDTLTGSTYENALATPDEANLIYVTPEETFGSWSDFETEPRPCVAPLATTCPFTIPRAPVTYAFWYRYDQIGLLSCYEQGCYLTSHSWQLAVDYRFSVSLRLDYFLPLVRQLAYDELYDTFIFVVDDYTLHLNSAMPYGMDEERAITLDLSDELDSPIGHVEWGQPIFYARPPVQGYNP